MGYRERLDMFVHRLETLTRKKFKEVNGNKHEEGFWNYPTSVVEFINLRNVRRK